MPHTIGLNIDRQIRTKSAQHPFAMVAGGHWLDHFSDGSDV